MGISVVITLHISAADSGAENRAHYRTKSYTSLGWKLMACFGREKKNQNRGFSLYSSKRQSEGLG